MKINERRERYEPTPKEIRAACERIQAEWSPTERKKRIRNNLWFSKPFEMPCYDVHVFGYANGPGHRGLARLG